MPKDKITAVVIARKGSKRLPRKMYQYFNGKQLIKLKIEQLMKSNVDEIAVGSDDEKLDKICKSYKDSRVNFYLREKKYCDEVSASPNDMVKNMLSFFDSDVILWAHPTNPLTNEKHYNNALKIYKKKKLKNLYGVSKLNDYFWDHKKKPINHNPLEKVHTLLKLHKVKYIYVDNGAIYIRKHKDMKKDGKFWGPNGYMYVMEEVDGWDINTRWDLEACKLASFSTKTF